MSRICIFCTVIDKDGCQFLSRNPSAFKIGDPSPYQFEPVEEALFPDVSCLGFDSDGDPGTVTLLPMAADPSSAEQFSFAFAELGNNASIDIDLPDRVEALRGLVLDRSRKISTSYDSTVTGLCRLCEERHFRSQSTDSGQPWTIEDCKKYVRRFAQEQNVGLIPATSNTLEDIGNPESPFRVSKGIDITRFMLPEKTAYSSAVENFKALMDNIELVGFAEGCMVELLAEDVSLALSKGEFSDFRNGARLHLPDASLPKKPVSVPG